MQRKDLLIRAGLFLQHLEGIESTYEDMERAHDRIREEPQVPEKVFVAVIETDRGTVVSVHRTDAGANEAIYDYVVKNWGEYMGNAPMPESHEDAINEFFDGETDIYKVEELELRD